MFQNGSRSVEVKFMLVLLSAVSSCLEPGELCDPADGEISLEKISNGHDLSGWWGGKFDGVDRIQQKMYIDFDQSPRKWYRYNDPGGDSNLEYGELEFGCSTPEQYPLVEGGENRYKEDRGGIGNVWGSNTSSGKFIRLVKVDESTEEICLYYLESRVTSGTKLNEHPLEEKWCFKYDYGLEQLRVLRYESAFGGGNGSQYIFERLEER